MTPAAPLQKVAGRRAIRQATVKIFRKIPNETLYSFQKSEYTIFILI